MPPAAGAVRLAHMTAHLDREPSSVDAVLISGRSTDPINGAYGSRLRPTALGTNLGGILVINPNSSERISAQIRKALSDFDSVTVVTSASGPSAIETDEDVLASIDPMLAVAASQPADAIVVACFSDPGLDHLRGQTSTPVFGIAESAMQVALTAGNRSGVISSMKTSLPRHERYWERLGVSDSVVADIPLELGVLDLDTPEAESRALWAGRQLIDAGADVIVLGCTGLTHMQESLEEMLGVLVVDPCLAAVETAEMALAEDL